VRKRKEIPTLLGRRFGRLLVIEMLFCDITGNANHGWNTKCDCGQEKITNSWCLKYGKTKSCGCYQRDMFLKHHVKYTNNFALNAMVGEYKFGAKKRNLDFSLTHQECENIFSQNCYYCDSPPNCIKQTSSKKDKHTLVYNGIDRIDNKLGYFKDNVVACCKYCNIAKHNMEFDFFIEWVKKLSNNLKKRDII
jgi:hypothetical protein